MLKETEIKQAVRERYGAVAKSKRSTEHAGTRAVAEAFGYSSDELASIPAEANMGLSCGNPTAMASLRPGEVVVDLGSGGGLDVFLAAQKVGPTGKAIGIDMSPEMIERARRNAQEANVSNVEFHLSEIESLPLASDSVDCVISNCVINLVPDKSRALAEIWRVLKLGGRLAISDIALKKPLPEVVMKSLAAYTGCVAGAVTIAAYRRMLLDAGFDGVEIIDSRADLNAYARAEAKSRPVAQSSCCGSTAPASQALPVAQTSCCGTNQKSDPSIHDELAELLSMFDANEYAASVKVFALKPAG